METLRARAFVYDRLSSDATLMNLIGNRLYQWGKAPEGTPFPYVEYGPYADTPGVTMSGTVFDSAVRLQVKVWGSNSPQSVLEAVMDRIRLLLDRQKGSITNGEILTCNYIGSPPLPPDVKASGIYDQLLSEYQLYVQQTVFA